MSAREVLLAEARKHVWAAWQLSAEELASQAVATLHGLGMLVPEGGAAELERLRRERDEFCDRVDTLTAVAQGNKRHVVELTTECQRLQAELSSERERYKAGLRKADEHVNAMNAELKRYADGDETPVLWSVYNEMHGRALTAEAELKTLRTRVAELEAAQDRARAHSQHLAETLVARTEDLISAEAKPAPVEIYLSTSRDTCDHTLSWHRNDVGCTVDDCACGRFAEPSEPQPEP